MGVHLHSKVCSFSSDRQIKQGLYVTPELFLGKRKKKTRKNKREKRSDLLNKNLTLRENPMAKQVLDTSELPPLDSEMKVVHLQVAFSGTGEDLLGSCLH